MLEFLDTQQFLDTHHPGLLDTQDLGVPDRLLDTHESAERFLERFLDTHPSLHRILDTHRAATLDTPAILDTH
jgi:hypothetical protein